MESGSFSPLFKAALERRRALLARFQDEETDAFRLFHGVAEGIPGLTVDRYGPLCLAQTFREPLSHEAVREMEAVLREQVPGMRAFACNHRAKSARESFEDFHPASAEALQEYECREFGNRFLIRARHPGIDPWLFLDFRAGRRLLRQSVKGLSVLNLFSYTCSVGLTAALAGASEVWNVDFSRSNLEVGRRDADLNGVPSERFKTIDEDCIPVMRQLAGLDVGGRRSQKLRYKEFSPRQFDVTVLDPPAWAKSPFGAVDVAGDYASLFKPALLATREGGRVLATNHVASVTREAWADQLSRCAAKAGRPLRSLEFLQPEGDFPSFDGQPPLKIALCHA